MLVLSRRVGEEIVIGDNVRVRIVAAQGNKVRLAVSAPRAVRIDRLEVSRRRAEFCYRDDEPCHDMGFVQRA
jgi:carbon storage regulator